MGLVLPDGADRAATAIRLRRDASRAETHDADDDECGVRLGFGSASTLTRSDAEALANPDVAPDIVAVAGVSASQVTLSAGSTNWTTTLTGTTPSWQDVRSREVDTGRFISDEDEATAAAVVVLGPDTAEELFGDGNAVGQSVTYNGRT